MITSARTPAKESRPRGRDDGWRGGVKKINEPIIFHVKAKEVKCAVEAVKVIKENYPNAKIDVEVVL